MNSADVETCLIKIDMAMPSSLLCKLVFGMSDFLQVVVLQENPRKDR